MKNLDTEAGGDSVNQPVRKFSDLHADGWTIGRVAEDGSYWPIHNFPTREQAEKHWRDMGYNLDGYVIRFHMSFNFEALAERSRTIFDVMEIQRRMAMVAKREIERLENKGGDPHESGIHKNNI